MPLPAGTRIAHYEVLALAGAGGMGEVYRARDTQLKREVALKVLPASLTRDPARLARFQREAEILAALNHAGIATIHGFVHDGDTHAIVMEFVEGETLAERIQQGPLPIATVDAYARQIIAALEYAHDHNITHRDLKPANIKITPEGTIKLLDFGLAKATEDASPSVSAADSPTLTLGQTRAGAILGTAAYMSPEQAVGKPADRRSDIFSLGVVLYEMLTGQRAFTGESGPEILASVVKDEPDWSQLPSKTPAAMRDLLRRALVKERKQRMQAVGEARIALDAPPPPEPAPVAQSSRRATVASITAALMTVVAAAALWGWLRPAPAEPRPVIHFTTSLPPGGTAGAPLVWSRDGSKLLFAGLNPPQLYIRALDEPEAKPVPGTESGTFAAFSPDAEWIAFIGANGQLKKVPAAGGAALTLAEGAGNPLSWGEDDNILFTSGDGSVMRIPAAGGKPETIAAPDPKNGELALASPQLLPGGDYIRINVLTQKGLADFRVVALNPRTGERKTVLEGTGDARFAPSGSVSGVGHLVYGRNGSLFAAPFDARTLQAGPPAPVLQGLQGAAGLVVYGVSDAGSLAYAAGAGFDNILPTSTMIWVDRQGAEQPVPAPARTYTQLRLSPDGGRVAAQIFDLSQTVAADLWVYDLNRQTLNRVTFGDLNGASVWTPDGTRLVYMTGQLTSSDASLISTMADSSGQPATLWKGAPPFVPVSLSRDGLLIGSTPANPRPLNPGAVPAGPLSVLKLNPDSAAAAGKPEPFLDTRFLRANPQFSPDGKWVAFQSNQTGAEEIYVVPYPGPGGLVQISSGGGAQPRWNRNGRELFFRNGDKLMAVEVDGTNSAFRALTPHELFEKASPDYDVSPDGRRFLMLKPVPQGPAAGNRAPELHVIVNWFEQLRRQVPLP